MSSVVACFGCRLCVSASALFSGHLGCSWSHGDAFWPCDPAAPLPSSQPVSDAESFIRRPRSGSLPPDANIGHMNCCIWTVKIWSPHEVPGCPQPSALAVTGWLRAAVLGPCLVPSAHSGVPGAQELVGWTPFKQALFFCLLAECFSL